MKYLLTVLIISALSCSKDTKDEQFKPPTATNTTCATWYSSPSIPNANWTVTLNIPDTNTVAKLTFRVAGTMATVFEIIKPKSKTYTELQRGRACPTYNAQAYYFFEWAMADGSIKKDSSFQVWQ